MPIPVSDKEIEKILGQIKDGVAQPKSAIEYSVGESSGDRWTFCILVVL